MRKRIARGIRASAVISIIFFSIIIMIIFGFFARAAGTFICYFMSNSIAKEISSPYFQQNINLKTVDGIDPSILEMDDWGKDLSDKLKLSRLLGLNNVKLSNIQGYEDPYFMDVYIIINNKLIYTTDNDDVISNEGIEELINRPFSESPKSEKHLVWLNKYLDIRGSYSIKDTTGSEVGTVISKINRDLLIISLILFIVIVLIIGGIANIIAGISSNIFSRPIIMPLNRLVDKMEAVATGNLEESLNNPIVVKKPLREIELFINSTNTIISRIKGYTKLLESQNSELEIMAQDQQEVNAVLARRNNQLHNILDNVGQGFLTFGGNLLINEECSLQCHNIFEECISGRVLSDILYQEDKEQRDFLNSVFLKILQEEDKDKLDLYIHLLPEEILIKNRTINLEYKVVHNIDSEHKKCIMIILTDLTEQRLLEEKMEEEKGNLRMVVKTVVHFNDFINCADDYENYVTKELPSLLTSNKALQEIIYDIYRNIHNFKGNFSQYDTFKIVSKLHELETWINVIKNKENITLEEFTALINQFSLIQWLHEDLKVLKSFLGEDFFNKKDTLIIEKRTLIKIEEKMVKLLSSKEYKLLLPDLRKLRYKSFKELLNGYPDYMEKLSERLEKVINPVVVGGDDILVDLDYYRDFGRSLVHVFRNCLDHGIESLEERVAIGKQELGTINCQIENVENHIRITISDDGNGIDVEEIRAKAASLGVISSDSSALLQKNELLELIFKEDFSTKETVNDISGRGIGLFSVMTELSKVNGKVEIYTEAGKGTEFIFMLPKQQVDNIPQISIRNIVGTLVSTASDFINNTCNIGLANSFEVYNSDRLSLNTISALINITGALHGIIIISFNESLAYRLVKDFMIDEVLPEEVNAYLEDVVAECSNIILGNSIKNFGEIEDLVSIGTPTIVCYKGASIRYSDSNMLCCNLRKEEYEIGFSFVCIDEILSEEVKEYGEYINCR
jgi:two-component system, chemotaxis family, sensor kinase CheA